MIGHIHIVKIHEKKLVIWGSIIPATAKKSRKNSKGISIISKQIFSQILVFNNQSCKFLETVVSFVFNRKHLHLSCEYLA